MSQRILIKIGGRAFEDHESLGGLAKAMNSQGEVEFVLVHGGGVEISQALKEANRGTNFIDGVRVTEPEDLKIVEGVLSGTVNERIANIFNENGLSAIRMSGKTEQLLITEPFTKGGHSFGLVGQVKKVNPVVVFKALENQQVPVVSPISADETGIGFNVNADSAAAALAVGSECTDLVYFTDVPGVQVGEEFVQHLTEYQAKELIKDGTIYGGMVAKMESIFQVLESGVERVHIAKWRDEEEFSDLIAGKPNSGTTITK
jgi:acetylglutamate kinase